MCNNVYYNTASHMFAWLLSFTSNDYKTNWWCYTYELLVETVEGNNACLLGLIYSSPYGEYKVLYCGDSTTIWWSFIDVAHFGVGQHKTHQVTSQSIKNIKT